MKKIATATIALQDSLQSQLHQEIKLMLLSKITTVIIQMIQHHIAILTLLMHTITHGKVTGIQVN